MRSHLLFAATAAMILVACARPEVIRHQPVRNGPAKTFEVKDQPQPEWDGKSWAVHEWGTFTGVQGSDGVVLDGLSHDEADLPDFVHDIRDFTCIEGKDPKMETPVIYFYGPEERRSVNVDVKFPRGVITQWYPFANSVNHLVMLPGNERRSLVGQEITELNDGYVSWGLRVLAPNHAKTSYGAVLPAVDETDPWRFCREVDANTLFTCRMRPRAVDGGSDVNGGRESEKCLFYRGLGDFALPLTAEVGDEELFYGESEKRMHVQRPNAVKLNVKLVNQNPAEPLRHVMLIYKHKHSGRTGFHYLESLSGDVELKDVEVPLSNYSDETATALADKLTKTGLFAKEAKAMVNTWREGYIDNEGLRVLYVLPGEFVDRELPLTISGWGAKEGDKITQAPIVRTFVARLELLTPAREAELELALKTIAWPGTEFQRSRELALAELDSWGRFSIPYLNRVKEMTEDEAVLAEVAKRLEAHKLRR